MALVGVVVAAGAGCASPPARPPRVGYARLEALVPLHPGYVSIAELERWARSARTAAREAGPALSTPAALSFPPPRGGELDRPQAQAVIGRLEQLHEQELARLAQQLEQRDQAQLARRAREAAREADALDAQRRIELRREFEDGRRQVLLASRAQGFDLSVRVAELQRALAQAGPGTVRAATQEQLQAAETQLSQASRNQAERIAVLQRRYDEQLASLRQAANAQVAREVETLRQSLVRQRAEELAAERARAAAGRRRLTVEAALPGTQVAAVAPGALGDDLGRAADLLHSESRRWSQDEMRDAGELARRRQELLDFVRQDTRMTAEALARARNWRIEWAPPGAGRRATRDVTARAEEWLRAYWGA